LIQANAGKFQLFLRVRTNKTETALTLIGSDLTVANKATTSKLEEISMKVFARFLSAATLIAATSTSFAADIVDTAVSAGQFTTLVKALKAADLVDALKQEGPYTVFAPNDAAFAKLPAGALDALLKDKTKLTAVLKYHVVPGKVSAAQVKPGAVKTLEGDALTVSTKGGAVMVDDAKVIKTDIDTSNGVIHVIDSVLMPK
jgi:uncharacterized surface protein with fasciclin (FAS1) repeats